MDEKSNSKPRTRVLLLIPHLGGGGAEQVMAQVARGLDHERYEVHLGLILRSKENWKALLPAWVSVHEVGACRVRSGAWKLLKLVWQIRPAVVLSGMAHLNFLVLLLRPLFPQGNKILVRQNGTVSAALAFGDLPKSTRFFYQSLYRNAERVICQSIAMAEDLVREIGLSQERVTVLLNPVDVKGIRREVGKDASLWTGSGPHLLAVGRLAPVKGFDWLLRALAEVRKRFPNADLTIVGGGTEEAALKALRNELHLNDAVHFAGEVDRPSAYFAGATAFVLSSRHEGMPNAMLEAAAGGLPVVTLPSSGGVRELLQGQAGVWLAAEISFEALVAALLLALGEIQEQERFSHPFVEAFDFERAIGAYERLIDEVLTQ